MEREILINAKIPCNFPTKKMEENIIKASKRNLLWFSSEDFAKGRELHVVGGAPSIKNYIEEVRQAQKDGHYIMALNGANDYLVDRGIIPDCYAMMDSRPINHRIINKPQKSTLFLLASQVHSKIYEKLKDYTVVVWHAEADYFPIEAVSKIATKKGLYSYPMLGGGQTVGTRSLCIGAAMGFKKIYLYGFDSSYEDGKHHAYEQKQNDNENTMKVAVNGKEFVTTPVFARQVYTYQQMRNMLKAQGVECVLRSDGLIKAVEEMETLLKEQNDTLEKKETHKYNLMWNYDDYRKIAPGEYCVNEAIEKLGITKEHSLIDFGVGTGRGAKKFQDLGYSIMGVDLAVNCLDEGIHIPLCIAPLWEMPSHLTCDYGYCVDVMEHIPTDKVEDVIKEIARVCKKGVYFQICLTEDHMGVYIDDHLHLTVKPAKWWLDLLEKYFIIKGSYEKNNNLNVWAAK